MAAYLILAGFLYCAANLCAEPVKKGIDDKTMKYFSLGDSALFGAMNLDQPGLENVKAAVAKGDSQAASAEWGKYWAARQSPRYYVAPEDYARGINEHLPYISSLVISKADQIWSNDFQFATYHPRRKGRSFQWIDQEPDTAYIGFLYFFWLTDLGRAYALTGDEKYPAMFREIVCSLWDAAPEFSKATCGEYGGFEVLLNSGLGSSLRCIFMMDGYWLMRRSPSFTPELHSKMLRLFLSHARYVFENHMGSYDHSNFQATESAWMATAGVMLPEFRESREWRNIGVKRTQERIILNFDKDGAQIEQCPQYHLTGIRDISRVLMILHANGIKDISGDKELWKKMERIYDYPIRITHSTGHLGLFNSGVYGTEAQVFFPLGVALFDSPLHAWAASRYIKPDFIPVAKGLSEYLMLMDGAWALALDKARKAHPNPPVLTSDLLNDSGLAILRSGWDENAFSLLFDFNLKPWGGHAFNGRLSFDLFAYGVPMVVNPGSPISYSMPVYANWCRQTIGHNTVMINEYPSPRAAECAAWQWGRKTVFISARILNYAGFTHQRSIAAVPGEYFFFFDRLTGAKDKVPLAWLLHSPLDIAARNDGAITSANGKPGLLIMADTSTREESEVVFGKGYAAVPVSYHKNYQPLDAWRSDVPYVRINSKTDTKLGGQTYGVLLAPFKSEPPSVELTTQPVPGATRLQVHAVSIRWPDHSDLLTVDYRKEKPAFSIVRKDLQGQTLWAQE